MRRWNSWLKKKNSFFLSCVEAREEDRPAERVAGVVARGLRLGSISGVIAFVQARVGVPARAPSVPVAGAVELPPAALGDDLQLAADGASVLSAW